MLLASLSLPPAALALERAADAVPDIEVEAERVAAHSTKWVMPCLWVTHPEFDRVEDAFRSDPSVAAIVEQSRFDETAFYHVEWDEDVERRINSYIDKEGSLLEARLANGSWDVDIRFVNRAQFDEFRDRISDRGHSFELLGLSESDPAKEGEQHLTPAQRDALVTASKRGYYRVPREATVDDLATELDCTHQAVSELLRRGTDNLVGATLLSE